MTKTEEALQDSLSELLSLKKEDEERIIKAYEFAKERHGEQKRKTGEPYIVHPLNVALILARLGMDTETVIAGLLHDTLEDTRTTREELKELFGENVALLVEGVTKIGKIKYKSEQAENYRKLILATAKDPRVIILKLADRLDNLKTLWVFREEKRKRIARETLEIFAPLAHRLGIWKLKNELEDLSFRYLYPEEYEKVKSFVQKFGKELESYLKKYVVPKVKEALRAYNINAEIQYRSKHLYSIWEKTKRKGIRLEDVHDILGVRIIVNTVPECYTALGIVHTLFKPIPGRFKDYISLPKPNLYQSLHTTVIADKGRQVEFQIRTWEMHERAEKGIASHWAYKQGDTPKDTHVYAWLRELVESIQGSVNPGELLENLKNNLFSEEVFVFTPKGDLIVLPKGSTPVDFAYKIHTDIGNHCAGARVNGRQVPLNYELRSGDVVEIITNPSKTPSYEWLGFVKTTRARNKIKQFLKQKEKEIYLNEGRRILEKIRQKLGLSEEELMNRIRQRIRFGKEEELLLALGKRKISPANLLKLLLPKEKQKTQQEKKTQAVIKLDGLERLQHTVAECCKPVPGDDVFGVITRSKGLVLHEAGCPNLKNVLRVNPARVKKVLWEGSGRFPTDIRITAKDRIGLLSDIANAISQAGANIRSSNTKTNESTALLDFTVEVRDKKHLLEVCERIKRVQGVETCRRLYR
ncbi:MAG: bifunctional (p)ppGpp synthetase/guanosine-3',5'-bis(diphosphate) 3'-pyrophosphohydrolase [Aquificae bacterium]|nr:bifunctional (p)ppGpp synthetase/guanosine-3',5'-bis(diphosphate) 3'-pyrophosphohydrolase [Aquificota bacterium]